MILENKIINANIKGVKLDLSIANMLQFLEKERNDGQTKMVLSYR